MNFYFFLWNPEKDTDSFADYDKIQSNARAGLPYSVQWICPAKSPQYGDVAIVQRTGNKNNGVFAKGSVAGSSYLDENNIRRIGLKLDSFLPIGKEISREEIVAEANYRNRKKWMPMASGNIVPEQLTQAILSLWDERSQLDTYLPEEVKRREGLPEGAVHQILVNAYERSAKARKTCIDYYGSSCCICSFNFGAVYGEIGDGFIHVHHLKPLSEIGERYELDPIKDLRPVCPNCHAMLHKGKPTFSIEEMQALLKCTPKSK